MSAVRYNHFHENPHPGHRSSTRLFVRRFPLGTERAGKRPWLVGAPFDRDRGTTRRFGRARALHGGLHDGRTRQRAGGLQPLLRLVFGIRSRPRDRRSRLHAGVLRRRIALRRLHGRPRRLGLVRAIEREPRRSGTPEEASASHPSPERLTFAGGGRSAASPCGSRAISAFARAGQIHPAEPAGIRAPARARDSFRAALR